MAQTSFYSKNFTGWPPVLHSEHADPNSDYWWQQVVGLASHLYAQLGARYEAWLETVPDNLSHRAFFELLREYRAAVELAAPVLDSIAALDNDAEYRDAIAWVIGNRPDSGEECHCNTDPDSVCRVCQWETLGAMWQQVEISEVPF